MTFTIDELQSLESDTMTAIAELIVQLSPDAPVPTAAEILEIIEFPGSTILIASESKGDETMIGMLTLVMFRVPTGLRARIEDVVVDRGHRRRGIGRKLVSEALDLAKGRGARGVDLTSNESRIAANQLYIEMGFEVRETNVYRYGF